MARSDIELAEVPRALRERIDAEDNVLLARFELPVTEGVEYLNRTHAAVEAVATHVMDTALDPRAGGVARRSGVIRTGRVSGGRPCYSVRFRYHIITRKGDDETAPLAEDCQILSPSRARRKTRSGSSDDQAAALLGRRIPSQTSQSSRPSISFAKWSMVTTLIARHLDKVAKQRGEDLLKAHRRVRQASRALKGTDQRVEPKLPPDVLGITLLAQTKGGRIGRVPSPVRGVIIKPVV